MPMKVMSTDTGIEIAVTRVERTDSRNTRITMTAKTRPSRPSVARLSIDCWMNGAWSNTTVNFVLSPIASSSVGIASLHGLRHRDGVAGRRLGDRDGERRLAVDARDAGDRVVLDLDARDIRDRLGGDDHGRLRTVAGRPGRVVGAGTAIAAPSSGSAPICFTEVIFGAGLHGEGRVVLGDRAGGQQRAVRAERVADRLGAEPGGGELVRHPG